MKVPFVDLYAIHQPLEKAFARQFESILHSSSFVAGKATASFEEHWAAFCGTKHALVVNNGTSALYVAMKAFGFPVGSEVILPVNTFIATAEGVVAAGLKPVFVDVDPVTMLMDLDQAVKRVRKSTVAIIPVHLYGQLVDVPLLKKKLKTAGKKVVIVEDAAQAHGATRDGKRGITGDIAAYSFYPGKNLGALGEAGAVVTNSESLHTFMRLFRGHGSEVKYYHEIVGMNLRASEMQAAFLDIKLPLLAKQNDHRVKAVKLYTELLQGISGVSIQPAVTDGSHVYHLYVVQVKKREKLIEFLHGKGIDTGIHYPVPLHLQKAFKSMKLPKGSFPVAEAAAKKILSLPMFATITEEQVREVCSQIRAFYEK